MARPNGLCIFVPSKPEEPTYAGWQRFDGKLELCAVHFSEHATPSTAAATLRRLADIVEKIPAPAFALNPAIDQYARLSDDGHFEKGTVLWSASPTPEVKPRRQRTALTG